MPTAELLDDRPVFVPARAVTPDGFQAWLATCDLPEHAQFSPGADGLVIDGTIPPPGRRYTVRVPASAATVGGFRDWAVSDDFPKRGKISFLDEEIVIDMSPEEFEKHNKPKVEVHGVIRNLNRDCDLGTLYGDGVLLTNRKARLSTEPDGQFVTWESFRRGRVKLTPRTGYPDEFVDMEGTPDWVLEIVSRGNPGKDIRTLRRLYHRAGIPEYWLVNVLGEEIDFQILVRGRKDYVPVTATDGWFASPVFGRGFRLRRDRDRIGQWRYTLDVRETEKGRPAMAS